MAGLLDFNDPQTVGLLSAGLGLLNASGPSRMPVSLGQAAAQGGMQGLNAYRQQQAFNQQQALSKAQLDQLKLNTQLLQGKVDFFNGTDQQNPTGSLPTESISSVGPSMFVPQTPSAGQQQTAGGLPVVPGFDQRLSRAAALGYLDKGYVSAIASANAPTDFQKIERAAAAGDPDAQAQLKKLNYIAPPSFRPGGWTLIDGQWKYLPKLPDASLPVDPNNPAAGVTGIPNAPAVIGANAYPVAAAKAAVTPVIGVSGNSPTFVPGGALAAAQGPGATFPGGPASRAVAQAPQVPGAAPQVPGAAPQAPAPVAPDFKPGFKESQVELAKSGAKRYNATVDLAAESPMRINVLDNIINLSAEGTATGPGAEWQNKVLGYAANTPLLGSILSGTQDNVGKFQELQKFTYQNALRNWQAAGGTGTDAQMVAASHANPNDKLFPQALQSIAKWGKASELALQAKANAQDQWLVAHNNDVSKQNEFEAQWRKNFDPRIYQMQLMNPTELQQFTGKLSNTERTTLLNKYRYAKQNGWL